MFGTEGVKVDKGMKTPQFIQIGPNKLKINSLERIDSKSTDKFKVIANFETEPMDEVGFEGWKGAEGQIGRVDLSIFTDGTDKYVQDFLSKVVTIADSLGVKAQVDAIKSPDIDDYLDKVSKLFANKFAWFLIGGEEYAGQDKEGKPRVKTSIKLTRYSYVAASEPELKAKMKDGVYPTEDTPWFYKKLEKMDEDKPSGSSEEEFTEGDGAF